MRFRVCRDCSHERSIHQYDPADLGRKEPAKCQVPNCPCTRYVKPAKGERVRKMKPTENT